jgi:dCMP deaminase
MARYHDFPIPGSRPDIDTTLMGVALLWEDRSTCDRNHVGAVIAKDGRHIGSGYNGAPAGMSHCDHGPLPTIRRVSPVSPLPTSPTSIGCRIAIHAEANAIAYAARHGVSVEGATIYTTLSPCYECAKLIIAAGLVRVVFNRSYRDPAGIDLLRNAGLTVDNMRQ